MSQKPYISKVGQNWIIVDSQGNDAFITKDYDTAQECFDTRYDEFIVEAKFDEMEVLVKNIFD